MLTDTQVRQLKPAEKSQYLFDGGGLYIEVTPSGGKLWRYKYRCEGKQKKLSLGMYPDVGVREARDRHAAARKSLADGIDPSAKRQAQKRESLELRSNTFKALADLWYAQKAIGWAPATADKARTYLDSDLIPALGDKPMANIRRSDLIEILRKIESRNALDIAKKCRGWLSGIFRYALVAEVIEINPATDLDVVAAPMRKRRHYAHLPLTELPGLLKGVDGYGGKPLTRYAIKLLMLTAARPGELRAAQWSEIDLEGALWSVPAERMKMRRPHLVPLPAQAVSIFREIAEISGHQQLIFPARNKPRRPMSENTVNQAIGRIGYKDRQTGHGFRHLISTALNEAGYNRDWIERQLAHEDEDESRAVYNKAEYLDQRRVMMQEWADYLDTIRSGGKASALSASHHIGARQGFRLAVEAGRVPGGKIRSIGPVRLLPAAAPLR